MDVFEIIATAGVILLYLCLLALPLVGIGQIIMAIILFFNRKKKPLDFRKALNKYWFGVITYGLITMCIHFSEATIPFPIVILLFIIIPIGIAIYFWKIVRTDYPEELEKLIF